MNTPIERIICKASFLLFTIALFTSCKKWLDVKPDSSVYADDILTTSDGFQKALAGVYNTMAQPAVYGKEAEFGMMDVLAGYWNIGAQASHEYYDINQYNYTTTAAKAKIDALWGGLYSSIRQVNIILEHVDNIKNDEDYNIIRGEALGLRAFLHFELFRFFGPVVKTEGLNAKAIPYYTTSTKTPQPFLKAGEVLNLIEQDLQNALVRLKNDPIKSLGRAGNDNDQNTASLIKYNYLIDRRGVRMNYYAVEALLARKSLWYGNLDEAENRAQSLIDELKATNAVRLLEPTDVETQSTSADIRFTVENIFGLFVNKDFDYTKSYFVSQYQTIYTALKPAYPGFLDKIYEQGTGSTLDYRLNLWKVNTDNFNKFYFNTQLSQDDLVEQVPQEFEVQLINLPELYFIVAEANLKKNPIKAIENINTIRQARNMPLLSNQQAGESIATNDLFDEMRREYIGEGFLFSFYKRMFHSIYRPGAEQQATTQIFDLPIPADETIYNNAQ